MGVLRKGQGWFEKNYRSPQEIAQEEFLNSKREQAERIKKLEDEAYKLACQEWMEKLTQTEIEEIASVNKNGSHIIPQSVRLKLYFKENIWLKKRSEYIKNQ